MNLRNVIKRVLGRNDSDKEMRRYFRVNKENFEKNQLLIGKMLCNQIKAMGSLANIQDAEFRVFSQMGDDGIIQYLIGQLDIPFETFIEFGVQDYSESNTRFLLMNNNWRGLVMDGSEEFVSSIKRNEYYWRHDLTAKTAFVTTENINQLISEEGFHPDVGIYHIDIDGNDYWIWKATTTIKPVIVIVEYQSLFGADRAITIPYKKDFYRTREHYSNLYYGASLPALCDLADEKGYFFVGSNSAGNNAYFVRKDKIGRIKTLTAIDGYVASSFKESRDSSGALTFLRGDDRAALLKDLEVFNTRTGKLEKF